MSLVLAGLGVLAGCDSKLQETAASQANQLRDTLVSVTETEPEQAVAVTTTEPKLSAEEVFAQASPSVGRVLSYDVQGRASSQGTGFLVSADGLMVTNEHVIEQAARITVQLPGDETPRRATIVSINRGHDLALLRVSGLREAKALLLAEQTPAVGQRVYALGNPHGLDSTFSQGIVSSVRWFEGVRVVQTTAAISPGSSGGPLLDGQGQVIGINTFQHREGQSLNFAVDVAYLRHLLPDSAEALGDTASGLVLQATMDGARPMAMLNNEMITIGQTTSSGHRLVEVGAGFVIVEKDGERQRVEQGLPSAAPSEPQAQQSPENAPWSPEEQAEQEQASQEAARAAMAIAENLYLRNVVLDVNSRLNGEMDFELVNTGREAVRVTRVGIAGQRMTNVNRTIRPGDSRAFSVRLRGELTFLEVEAQGLTIRYPLSE